MALVSGTLKEITELPGVKDLPFSVRAKFALALKKEGEGDYGAASTALEQAIAAGEKK